MIKPQSPQIHETLHQEPEGLEANALAVYVCHLVLRRFHQSVVHLALHVHRHHEVRVRVVRYADGPHTAGQSPHQSPHVLGVGEQVAAPVEHRHGGGYPGEVVDGRAGGVVEVEVAIRAVVVLGEVSWKIY